MSRMSMNRREFARLFALGGSAALLGRPELMEARPRPLSSTALQPGAVDWAEVRRQFLMPPDVTVLNAANLCPAPRSVAEAVGTATERMDATPFAAYRSDIRNAKEHTRNLLATFLRVTPEEILITRNTSESNNWVSNGLDLGPSDEVLIFSDNHPSNNQAWKAKGERFGYTVREVPHVDPHPGAEYYIEAFAGAITPRTRLISFTHLTNTSGDVLPARELCAMARERGVLSMVDGAQSFGLFDVDLASIRPDFYSGSAHKWPCGPKETGLLYVNSEVHDRFWPSIYSAYGGARGLSRTHEGLGQRDTPAIQAFGGQIEFLMAIGQGEIEARSRALATRLVDGLTSIDGVHLWTSDVEDRRGAVVTFRPGDLEPARVLSALEDEGIVASARSGSDRPGIRFAPHFYNMESDVDRALEAIERYMVQGL